MTEPIVHAPEARTAPAPLLVIVRHVLPWLILACWFALIVLVASRPVDNGDTWFHLRFGEEFLTGHWSLRHPGHATTFESADWVPTQWLPQILMAALERLFGLPAIAWLLGLLMLAVLLAWYAVARRHVEPIVAVVIVSAAMVAAAPGLSARPQVLSFVAAAVVTEAALTSASTGRPAWWLLPVTWVWAMCHGMWPVGIAVSALAVIGAGLDRGWGVARRLTPVPVLQLAVAALTPVGPALYVAVARVNGNRSHFSEWGPPDFTTAPPLAALLLVAVAVILLARRRAASATVLMLVLAALGATVYSQRTVPIAAAMLVPLVARLAARRPAERDAAGRPGGQPEGGRRREVVALAAAAAVTLAALGFIVPQTAARPGEFPTWIDPAMAALPAGTPVLDDSRIGGYLLWAHPDLDPVEHGYGDVYTAQEMDRIGTLNGVGPGWLDAVVASRARVALQPSDAALAEALRLQGWSVTAQGGGWVLLVAPEQWPAMTASALR